MTELETVVQDFPVDCMQETLTHNDALQKTPWRLLVLAEQFNSTTNRWDLLSNVNAIKTQNEPFDSISNLQKHWKDNLYFGGDWYAPSMETPALCVKLFSYHSLTQDDRVPIFDLYTRFEFWPKIYSYTGVKEEEKIMCVSSDIDHLHGEDRIFPHEDCDQKTLDFWHEHCSTNIQTSIAQSNCTLEELHDCGYEQFWRPHYRLFKKFTNNLIAATKTRDLQKNVRLVFWMYVPFELEDLYCRLMVDAQEEDSEDAVLQNGRQEAIGEFQKYFSLEEISIDEDEEDDEESTESDSTADSFISVRRVCEQYINDSLPCAVYDHDEQSSADLPDLLSLTEDETIVDSTDLEEKSESSESIELSDVSDSEHTDSFSKTEDSDSFGESNESSEELSSEESLSETSSSEESSSELSSESSESSSESSESSSESSKLSSKESSSETSLSETLSSEASTTSTSIECNDLNDNVPCSHVAIDLSAYTKTVSPPVSIVTQYEHPALYTDPLTGDQEISFDCVFEQPSSSTDYIYGTPWHRCETIANITEDEEDSAAREYDALLTEATEMALNSVEDEHVNPYVCVSGLSDWQMMTNLVEGCTYLMVGHSKSQQDAFYRWITGNFEYMSKLPQIDKQPKSVLECWRMVRDIERQVPGRALVRIADYNVAGSALSRFVRNETTASVQIDVCANVPLSVLYQQIVPCDVSFVVMTATTSFIDFEYALDTMADALKYNDDQIEEMYDAWHFTNKGCPLFNLSESDALIIPLNAHMQLHGFGGPKILRNIL